MKHIFFLFATLQLFYKTPLYIRSHCQIHFAVYRLEVVWKINKIPAHIISKVEKIKKNKKNN